MVYGGKYSMVTAKQIPDVIIATLFWQLRKIVQRGSGVLFAVSFPFVFCSVYEKLFDPVPPSWTETRFLIFLLPLAGIIMAGSIWALFMSLRPLAVLVTGILGVIVFLSGIFVLLALAISARTEAVRSRNPLILFFEVSVIVESILVIWRIILFRIVSQPSWIVRVPIIGLVFILGIFQGLILSQAVESGGKEIAYLTPLFFLSVPLCLLYVYSSFFARHQEFSETLRGLKPDKSLLKCVGNIVSEIKEADVGRSNDIIEFKFNTKPKRCRAILYEEIIVLLPLSSFSFWEPKFFLELCEVPIFVAKPEFRLHVQAGTEDKRSPTVTVHIHEKDMTGRISAEHLRRYREWVETKP